MTVIPAVNPWAELDAETDEQREARHAAEEAELAAELAHLKATLGSKSESTDTAHDAEETGEATASKKVASGFFTDLKLGRFLAERALRGKYIHTGALGWLYWSDRHGEPADDRHPGVRWKECGTALPAEAMSKCIIAQFDRALERAKKDPDHIDMANEWRKCMSESKLAALVKVAARIKGIRMDSERLDADPDLLNTPSGIVDLRTGEVLPHKAAHLMTKMTRGSYRAGFTHPDWQKALEAVREDVHEWFQNICGQAITGHHTPDGVLLVLHGGGRNGKTAITSDGIVPALGDYGYSASTKLLTSGEHSTEKADLRGRRFVIAEEMTESRALDTTALKKIQDTATITARRLYKENATFRTSHSLFATTNYVPIVSETDDGTWRRLCMLRFPFRFRKPGQECTGQFDRMGDPTLKSRISESADGQHDAIVTWCVEGAIRWYAGRERGTVLDAPASVEADTEQWRLKQDRVLAYVIERLERAPGRCVLSSELLLDFNAWLRDQGHNPWTKETFAQRFDHHEKVLSWHVESKRTSQLDGLDRLSPEASLTTPCRAKEFVRMGVVFRRDSATTGGSGDPFEDA